MFNRDIRSRGGGVFILAKDLYIASRVQECESDCEILWVKLQLTGSLHIAAYDKPSESGTYSSEESVELVRQVKGQVWILGDFSYPKFT